MSTIDTHATQALPLLADPTGYQPCGFDLVTDAWMREYWFGLFGRHFPSLIEEALAEGRSRQEDESRLRARCAAARCAFDAYLDDLKADEDRGYLNTLMICEQRERVLREHGFDDPYRLAKRDQNDAAIALLPGVLAELDRLKPRERAVRVIEGVFAGNIFDLGATETVKLFQGNGQGGNAINFHTTRDKLKPRPWLVDDLDRWLGRLSGGPAYGCALLLVDNAGWDIVLGMIPFARDLLTRGTGVVIAANTYPSLNDITYNELRPLIESIGGSDEVIGQALQSGVLEIVPSGNGTPLFDLTRCSNEMLDAVTRREPDLIVLEGMGRALETNFRAEFTCDAIRVAMVKDAGVARFVGGGLYDLVFGFTESPKR